MDFVDIGFELQVNDYCLLDALEQARDAARGFAAGNSEPGPYFILEVLSDIRFEGPR